MKTYNMKTKFRYLWCNYKLCKNNNTHLTASFPRQPG